MNASVVNTGLVAAFTISKSRPQAPAFRCTDAAAVCVNGALTVNSGDFHATFADGDAVAMPDSLIVGADYEIVCNPDSTLSAHAYGAAKEFGRPVIGGFHFAPGSNALARTGGDTTPAINPYSIYDQNFRPACSDPRGMALIGDQFWCDIYLLGVDHVASGTSRFGARIADGGSLGKLDYPTACEILGRHGKQVLGLNEFFAAAYGVTEKSSQDDEPTVTGVDAPRTSKYGIMQATGNKWVWGHDEDPDAPRASFFGGSWIGGGNAGSRCAGLGDWPGYSVRSIGVRGRSDHLNHG